MELRKHVKTYIEFDTSDKSTIRMLVARCTRNIVSRPKINILKSCPGSPFLIY